MTPDAAERHLTTPTLLEHWDSGVPVLIPLGGDPPMELRIDLPQGRLTLRAPIAANTKLPANTLAHVALELMADGDARFLEIFTTDDRLIVDGYSMLSAIADRVQLDGVPPLVALDQTLETWRSILAMRIRMSPHVEVGLFGELLVVEALQIAEMSVRSWRGGLSEEHDFGFSDSDVEVKTTTGERRQHWVHGLGQLAATGYTPLWVLSVQITRGGDAQGRSLPEFIDDVLEAAEGDRDGGSLRRVLEAAGWKPEERDLFTETWRLRAPPLAVLVDDSFPRLTSHFAAPDRSRHRHHGNSTSLV